MMNSKILFQFLLGQADQGDLEGLKHLTNTNAIQISV